MEKEESNWITDVFGPKDFSTPPSPIVAAIFSPYRAPHGEQWRLSESEKKTDPVTQPWTPKKAVSGEEKQSWNTKEKTSYLKEEKPETFQDHYSSSIYYGGRFEVPVSPNLNEDVRGKDDPGSTLRGNWWEGSVYY